MSLNEISWHTLNPLGSKMFPLHLLSKVLFFRPPPPLQLWSNKLKRTFVCNSKQKLAQKTHVQSPSRNKPKCQQSFQIQTWDVFTTLWQQLLLDIFLQAKQRLHKDNFEGYIYCKQNKMPNLKFGNVMIFVDMFGLWNKNKKRNKLLTKHYWILHTIDATQGGHFLCCKWEQYGLFTPQSPQGFLFNFVRWVDWQSSTRGLNQIWQEVRDKSKKFFQTWP